MSQLVRRRTSAHEKLGCTDCMTLTHKTCDLEYIPDKCVGISYIREYLNTLKNLDLKLKEADAVMKMAEDKNKEIDAWYDDVIKDVERVKEEINGHLDTIEKKIKEEAKRRRSKDKQEIKTILEKYTNFISDMRKLKLSLKDLKEQNKKGDVFISIKRAKSKLQSEVMLDETAIEKTTKLFFECNKALENILSIDCFGKLKEHTTNVITNPNMQSSPTKPITPPIEKNPFSSISHKTDINIKTRADCKTCFISGCTVLSSDKLILADNVNKKLQVFNLLAKSVVEEKQLDLYPWDTTVLPENKIAVTLPDREEIMIMRTTGQLSTSRTIKVKGRCRGITYKDDCLYVVCLDPKCVLILDMKGKVKNTIPLKDKTRFRFPSYIEVSKDNKLLYISDYFSNNVVSVTMQGEISALNKDISRPQGLVMFDDGSLLVCSNMIGSIYRLQADLKHSYKLISDVHNPMSICCSFEKGEVFRGGNSDLLKVFSLQ